MRAGVSEGLINPWFPVLMAGYPLPKDRYDTGIHDDLAVHCFYFENGGEELGIVSVDAGELSKRRALAMREAVGRACGIPQRNIAVCCTHTHSGPVTTTLPFALWTDERELYPFYLDFLTDVMAGKMREAKDGAFPARLAAGKGRCGRERGVGGNRRDRDGTADPEVCCLGIFADGALRGALVNYALHPTFLHAESRELSADYPGYACKYLRERHPGTVAGFTLGAAGDQSSRHFRAGQSFSEARRVGEAIAGEAERVLAAAHELAEPRLFAESYEFMPPVFEQPALGEAEAGAERAERALAESESEGRPYAERRSLECALFGARHRLDIAKAGPSAARIMAAALPFEIQIMGFGGCRMVFYSCEVFAEYGLRLKRESPCPLTFLSTCANGAACGYICTPESHAEGGYEAAWTSYRPETGGLMVDFTLERLKENML